MGFIGQSAAETTPGSSAFTSSRLTGPTLTLPRIRVLAGNRCKENFALIAHNMASAMDKLPTEPLELVLWFLPTEKLLIAQRVSRLWQQLISGSTKLQIALFRAPQPVE